MAKPNQLVFAAAKARLIGGLNRIIETHEQIRRDIEWWNANRPDAAPFDAGGDIVVVAIARQVLALIEAELPIPNALWQRLQGQIEANVIAGEEVTNG